MQTDNETQDYFDSISREVSRAYSVATRARSKCLDPEPRVDIPVAEDLAARVEGLLSTLFPDILNSGLKEAIRALEANYGKNDERVAILIGRDVAENKFSKFPSKEKAIDAGLRAAVAYLTLGVVTAPLEGISDVKIRKNPQDNSEYIAVYFAGPIRSAGGTASAMAVLAADFIRKHAGIGEYKPDENEINRYVTEVEDYYTRVTPKQYHPTREEVEMIIKNIPIEITGDPTEKLEVSNYKDLPRVETNRIRGGMCLVLLDGVPLKAEKLIGRIKKYPKEYLLSNWLWLEKFIELKHRIHSAKAEAAGAKYTPSTKYLSKVIAGRPVISFPATPGGFRLRYGRARTGGLAGVALHPATMYLTEFLAVGTQIATELPGKASVCTACDTIAAPVILLKNGDVVEVRTQKEAIEYRGRMQKLLSLGDLVVPFGEFVSNNHVLLPSAYVEEWWAQDVLAAIKAKGLGAKYETYLAKPYPLPAFDEAVEISKELGVPLHPGYNFFWHDITIDDLCRLVEWVSSSGSESPGVLRIQNGPEKEILERLCVPHRLEDGKIVLEASAKPFYFSLGRPIAQNKDALVSLVKNSPDTVSAISVLSGIRIMPHGPTRIGVKMGRPEKAERRLLKGRPQVLFPCGSEGGRMRNLMDTFKKGSTTATLYTAWCPTCKKEATSISCPVCRTKTEPRKYCRVCGKESGASEHCGYPTTHYRKAKIDVRSMVLAASKNAGVTEFPKLLKGVRGVFGQNRHAEPIEKGFLRAQHELYVNKDGTTRYDSSDVSLTHFRPSEAGVTVEQMRELGYSHDINGQALERADQVLELKPQDIIISDNADFSGADYLVHITQFVDSLLERYYGLPSYYNMKTKDELIGTLVIGLAPHTSAGIIGRIVGFTPAKVCFAHPFWHAGKRRNCFFGNEKILINNGLEFELLEIRDMAEKNLTGEAEKDSFGTEYGKITGLKTFAFNKETKKFELADITHVSRHRAPEKMMELKTKSGRKLIVTPDHPMINGCGEKIRAEDASEVLIPWRIENPVVQDTEKIDFLDISSKKDIMIRTEGDIFDVGVPLSQISGSLGMSYKTFTNYVYRKSYPLQFVQQFNQRIMKNKAYLLGRKRDKVSVKPEILLNEGFLCLLGFYLAEGYTKKNQKDTHQVSITATKPWAKEFLREKIKDIFGLEASVSTNVVTICSSFVHELFSHLKIGENAKNKRVPNFVYSLPKEKIGAFLRGYFSGDGSCSLNSTLEVNVTSVNKWLIDSVSLLLMFSGIRHSIYEENREIKSKKILEVYGRPKPLHSYKIRIYGDEARKFIEFVGFAEEKQLHAQNLVNQWLNKRGSGRTNFEGDAFSDKIVEKRIIDNKEEYVYDLTVDTHHTLICSGVVAGNCDGDEDSIMLLLDALLNFSREFLPDTRGGRSMDAPLVLTTCLNPEEVDDESWNVDIDGAYSREFYESTLTYPSPKEVLGKPRTVSSVIRTPEVFHIKFTHDTRDINEGPLKTKYVELASMHEKVEAQLAIGKKICAVDENKVAEAVLSKHFFRDIRGNLRTFSYQKFRCVSCNEKYRRPPLSGRCLECGGKLLLTVSEGSVKKYLEPSRQIMDAFKVSSYLRQQLALLEDSAEHLFGNKGKQLSLAKFNKADA